MMRTHVFDSDPLIRRAREAIENSREILKHFDRRKRELDERIKRCERNLIPLKLQKPQFNPDPDGNIDEMFMRYMTEWYRNAGD
jgi:hypothetical protein